jgi:hypothetical protein
MSNRSNDFKRRPQLPSRPPLSRSTSMQDPEDPVSEPINQRQSATATSTLLGRWRLSLKRRMQGSPTTSHFDPSEETTFDEDTTYDVMNLMRYVYYWDVN